jgi:hypothetical protein
MICVKPKFSQLRQRERATERERDRERERETMKGAEQGTHVMLFALNGAEEVLKCTRDQTTQLLNDLARLICGTLIAVNCRC